MNKVITILIAIAVVIFIGFGFYSSLPKIKLGSDLTKIDKPISQIMIKEIVIQENDIFSSFYELWADMDILNQLSKQGVEIKIEGDMTTGIHKAVQKELKKRNINNYSYKVIDKKGIVKLLNTKLVR